MIDDLAAALYASRICAYAQGMALIRAGSHAYRWSIDLAEIGRIWKGGCIIRARLLDPVRHAFGSTPDLANLLLDPDLARAVDGAQAGWRRTVGRAAAAGIPMPAHASALAYYDSYRTAPLPQAEETYASVRRVYLRQADPRSAAADRELREILEARRRDSR